MPGMHITVDRIAKYCSLRDSWSRRDAARIVLISLASARRLDRGTHFRQRPTLMPKPARLGNRRSAIWSDSASAYIASHPGQSAKAVFDHILGQNPDKGCPVTASHRRSFERWYVCWKSENGIYSKRYPPLAESYALLRSAHQGSFHPPALHNRKEILPGMPSILKMATSST
jgi:hypothetical protein